MKRAEIIRKDDFRFLYVKMDENRETAGKEKRLRTSQSFWWRRVDSNHRSETQQIYSLPPLATRELLHMNLSSMDRPQNMMYYSEYLPECQVFF